MCIWCGERYILIPNLWSVYKCLNWEQKLGTSFFRRQIQNKANFFVSFLCPRQLSWSVAFALIVSSVHARNSYSRYFCPYRFVKVNQIQTTKYKYCETATERHPFDAVRTEQADKFPRMTSCPRQMWPQQFSSSRDKSPVTVFLLIWPVCYWLSRSSPLKSVFTFSDLASTCGLQSYSPSFFFLPLLSLGSSSNSLDD